jgi:AraC-like DNA-binding protein
MAQIGLSERVTEPVTNVEYGRLWWLIAETIDDEFFGLAARPMRPGSFNLLCHAVLHAGTLERALRRALQFLNVVLDDPRGELRIRDGMAHVILTDAGPPRPAFAYRAYWLILMGVACWLIGRRIPLRTLDFACPAPVHRQDYHKFFGAPVLFDQPVTRLVFSSSYLSLPIIRSDVALESFLREAPANILIRYRHDNDLSARVRAQLNALPIAEWPSFAELAAGLGMSVPTLRRRLRGEGQSFSTIKDELRFVAAERLLQENRLSVAEVAAELGYSEPSAFYRAFHKWMGQSPGRFRTIQQEE